MEFPVPLQYQDDSIPGELLYGVILAEVGLDQTNNIILEVGVGVLFSCCCSHPGLEVFLPHPGRSPVLVHMEVAYQPCKLIPLKYGVV